MPVTVLERWVIDQKPLVGSNGFNAAGDALMTLGFVPAGYNLEIERLVVDCGNGSDFTLYAGDFTQSLDIREHALVTVDPVLVFDENSLIRFYPNEQITAVVSGGSGTSVAVVVAQAQTVLWRPRVLQDEVGPGTIVTRGLPEVGPEPAPDPGGWN